LRRTKERTAFSTPLMPKMDSYLILVRFEELKQFTESLQNELYRIYSDCWVRELKGEELVNFQQIINDQAKADGINAPKLLLDNSIYF
jgi:hypothetical protein